MHGKWPTSVAVVNLLLIDSSLLELFYINKLATHSWPSCLGKQKRNDFQINVPIKFKFVAKGLKFMLSNGMHTYPWKKYILAQPVSLPPGGEGGA